MRANTLEGMWRFHRAFEGSRVMHPIDHIAAFWFALGRWFAEKLTIPFPELPDHENDIP